MKIHKHVLGTAILLLPALNLNARPGMTLVVCDKVGLETQLLQEAMKSTKQVFADAGIDFVWVFSEGDRRPMTFSANSLEGCTLPEVDSQFLAVVSNDVPSGWPSEGLGFSSPGRLSLHRLYVFYDRVRRVVRGRQDSSVAVVLGHAIAHELGHLLLSDMRHRPAGIMSTNWGGRQMAEAAQGSLRFNPRDAQRMREEFQASSLPNLTPPLKAPVVRSAALTPTETHK